MPAISHTRKPSDDHSKWTFTLTDRDGNAIDVSSVTSVDLFVDDEDGTAVISDQSVTLEDGANGIVSYVFGTTELDSPGTYYAEFVIDRGTGTTFEHVPHDRNLRIEVPVEVQTGTPTADRTPFHERKPDDNETPVAYTLRDRSGTAIDLSSVTGVTAWVDAPDESAELSGASVTVTDAANGVVEYDVQSGDFATAGDYPVEFVIEYSDGSFQPVPHDGVETLRVTEQVK